MKNIKCSPSKYSKPNASRLWILILNQIHLKMNFSLARIAYRINCSPSTLQKLVKSPSQIPRDQLLLRLSNYYCKLFCEKEISGDTYTLLEKILIELINRGIVEKSATDLPTQYTSLKNALSHKQSFHF